MPSSVKKVLDVLQYFVFGGVLAIILYFFVIGPHRVDGVSMFSTFHNNDWVMVFKLSYALGGEPSREDVITFQYDTNNNYIKRVIGVPGDQITLRDGQVFRNGELLEEPYLDEGITTKPGSFLGEGETVTVPEGQYFVMGDNRPESIDSRAFGPVEVSKIEGRVFLTWWPMERLGWGYSE